MTPTEPAQYAETVAPEPTLIDLIQELRSTLGLFDGAMAIPPKLAWEDALAEVRRLRRYWLDDGHRDWERTAPAALGFAKRTEAENIRLRAALNKLAEDAEVAAQGGLHG